MTAMGPMLGAAAGFTTALLMIGIPLAGFLYRVDQHARKSVRLLEGEDEMQGDGALPRLRMVEQRSAEHRLALLRSEEVDLPDLEREVDRAADGGRPVRSEEGGA